MPAESRIYPPGRLEDPDAGWVERILALVMWREDIPPRHGEGLYMRRFFLDWSPYQEESWRWALHCFYRSDVDPDPHDHPFDFRTTVLSWWGYTDEEWDRRRRVVATTKMGWLASARRSALHIHRVQLERPGKRTWTFVRRSEKWRNWGFWTKNGFVPQEEYLGVKR